MTKTSPIVIVSIMILELILALLHINISNLTFDIIGFSVYTNAYLLLASYAFKLCSWHKVLVGNLFVFNIIEWLSVNVIKFNSYVYVWLLLLIMASLSILSLYLYLNNANHKTPHSKGT